VTPRLVDTGSAKKSLKARFFLVPACGHIRELLSLLSLETGSCLESCKGFSRHTYKHAMLVTETLPTRQTVHVQGQQA
jgi:hypothetical protein